MYITKGNTMSKLLPNNTDEENKKVNDLLIPVLEYLNTLEPDKGKLGFFSEDGNLFKYTTIEIKIKESSNK